ncbi:histidine phosphatase family protein [Ottowia sp.]|uniref:histidine phosphatase family protein n=1 Tax=Ottowia sp. TaxID=1898956 RepID=UPI0025E4EB40|nr:histidine phosphatase family protein [Ottowia sp.]
MRHAPVQVAPGLCYGRTDLPADGEMTRQAARALAGQLPLKARMFVSPLQRCELLAQHLRGLRPDMIQNTDPRLREMHFGAWEGRPWADIPRADVDAWVAGFAHARPGGDGETVDELMARVGAAWDDWRAGGRDAVWVTHAGVIRAAALLARGARRIERAGDWPAEPLAFGAAVVLEA